MAAPKLLALHRDVQVLACDCDGCTGLIDSEYVAESRAQLQTELPPEIPPPSDFPPHVHYPSFEVIGVRYSGGVPKAVHPCEVCGVAM